MRPTSITDRAVPRPGRDGGSAARCGAAGGRRSSPRWSWLVLALAILAARPAAAQTLDDMSSVEAFDREIDQAFDSFDREAEARFAALDAAIKQAFAEMEARIAERWGERVRMPRRKVWVGYQDDLETRVIVDYEAGRIAVESLETSEPAALHDLLDEILAADSEALDERDVVQKRIEEAADEATEGGREPSTPSTDRGPVPRELGRLADRTAEPDYETERVPDDGEGRRKVGRLSLPMIPDHARLSAERVLPVVRRFAARYDVSVSLVMSVIKNESAFNPRAKSDAPAFGLMQLVPRYGGRDAYAFVNGRERVPSPAYLYKPVRNIELGTAYLHLLDARYLDPIRNPQSRLYCVVAAYNTGAGNVARSFTGSQAVAPAARRINTLSPDDVYRRLRRDLPYAETRRYLRRVVRDRESFRHWD